MANNNKLELTWFGKDERPRLEPRILIEEPEFSHHALTRREGDHFDNMIIHGDNLLALKALQTNPNVCGKVKCIFIDPPYNTGSAFPQYDDGIEHSLWLTMMRDRLELLKELLSYDGSLWITVDDNEAHYLKVLCDEIFGRKHFVRNIVWQKTYTVTSDTKGIASSHDHMLVYAKSQDYCRNLLQRSDKQNSLYKYDDGDGRGLWRTDNLSVKTYSEAYNYKLINPVTGVEYDPPKGRVWYTSQTRMQKLIEDGRVFFGKDGRGAPQLKRYLAEVQQGVVPNSWWTFEEVGHNDEARKEQKVLHPEAPFSTPKPERLLKKVLEIATNPRDLVLDSFAGSGTTGAVAHKMDRRWIMVELGDHARTNIASRMQKVIDGTDKGGVTEACNWKGGGGYRFYKLAPSLLQKDKWGNLVINKDYQPEMLSEAMCKHMNYTYSPSESTYWMHGHASETAYIYVTTNSLSFEQIKAISDEVGDERSLLICCMAYEASGDNLHNLTIKKIPREILNKCEWGKDDYSLKIAALPIAEERAEDEDIPAAKTSKSKSKSKASQANLFDMNEGE